MEDRNRSTVRQPAPGAQGFPTTREGSATGAPGARLLAALLTLGAAVVHFAVAPMHFQEYLLFGLFFVGAGAAQAALSVAILAAPSRRLFAGAAAGTLGVIGLWAVSRTVGLPIGPSPWRPEAIGITDGICTLMEAISVVVFALLALRRPRARTYSPVRIALTAAPSLLLVAALTYGGTATAVEHMPVAFNAAPGVPGQPSTTVDLLTEKPGDEPLKSFTLTAEATRINGQQAWTYNGTVPGPELRVRQGDRLRVTLVNHLPASTTIHWHGVPGLPDAEDGVAGITQQAVAPGRSFTYEFVAREAGTYWYHSHQDTGSQLTMGLFGALVVEPRTGPTEDRDYTAVLHSGVGGRGFAVNGTSGDLRLDAQPGQTVRLRVIDAVAAGMDGGPETPVLVGAPYRVVALDGRDLNQPQALGPERLPIGMGQRADVVFTMPAAGAVRLYDVQAQGGQSSVQKALSAGQPSGPTDTVTVGGGAVPALGDPKRLPTFDLTRYGVPSADPVASASAGATYPIVITKQPGFRDGTIQLVHEINGQASPNVPPITVHQGEVVRLHIVNSTDEYHPMHLHGHTMSVLSRNGVALAGGPVRLDSILVAPNDTWDVAFLADNPGIWMFHCHVLLHASMGLTMTVNYAGISTPYSMGSLSGNTPE